jgi:hypothetical protein
VSSRNPLPSAANRLSTGIVYPRVFSHMQEHSIPLVVSSLDSFVGGACKTETGSSAGPRGEVLEWCHGMGST